ncbi:hypothetical protein [Hymenobacter sp. GOD-10R]|uniref:hypothetical protein n=1 Tax=Hymenobacter sp. GOD-10R TaxID=3093922 RepID=UPI002D7A2A0B|nr:hypothetical protein [Hymenobacter sp. GOD-10R]WRQ28087.1 hypothetical protein SD425_23765 [Hymenobacter sp. GOD-10R]
MLRPRLLLVVALPTALAACTFRMPLAERPRPVVNTIPPVTLLPPPKPPRIYSLAHLDTLAVHRAHVLAIYPAPRSAYDALPSPAWMRTSNADESEGEELDIDPQKEERQRLRNAGPLVKRAGRTLWLRPTDHPPLRLVDNPAEDYDTNIAYEYIASLPKIGQWLLSVHLYEGGYYVLVDQRTGRRTPIWGPPAISPNGRHFVCGNSDVLAHYEPNGLQVWSAEGTPRLLWERETEWGVQEPRWLDDHSILFQQDFFDKDDVDTRVVRMKVIP